LLTAFSVTVGVRQVMLWEPVRFTMVTVGVTGDELMNTVAVTIQPKGSRAVTVTAPVPAVKVAVPRLVALLVVDVGIGDQIIVGFTEAEPAAVKLTTATDAPQTGCVTEARIYGAGVIVTVIFLTIGLQEPGGFIVSVKSAERPAVKHWLDINGVL